MHHTFKIVLFTLFVIPIFFVSQLTAQNRHSQFSVAFYNTENLFDTIHNPLANDTDFLPQGKYHWNSQAYQTKLAHIAKVCAALNNDRGSDLMGLAEIENKQVLQDLIAQNNLSTKGYEIVHRDSKDLRGIDVALLYKKERFKPIKSEWLTVPHPDTTFRTREILICKGVVDGRDTINIIVAHLPSRINEGFSEENEIKRVYATRAIQAFISETWKKKPQERFIIMGDMNDTPMDESPHMLLYAFAKNGNKMINLSENWLGMKTNGYTIMYQGHGYIFDQVLVSKNLLDTTQSIFTHVQDAQIFHAPWLSYQDKNKQDIPKRTINPTHEPGYSDHYPISLLLYLQRP